MAFNILKYITSQCVFKLTDIWLIIYTFKKFRIRKTFDMHDFRNENQWHPNYIEVNRLFASILGGFGFIIIKT